MSRRTYNVGVFDSGVGGENIVDAIKLALPDSRVTFRSDRQNLPYGNKSPEQILGYMGPILEAFIEEDKVDAIVIACNTASTNCLPGIKQKLKVPVVGFVPMVKPAVAKTKTKVITVCATPGTLKSSRYSQLKAEFCVGIKVLEPDCSDWAELIEGEGLSDDKLKEIIDMSYAAGSDTIVLGCTHYHWIKERLDELSGPDIEVMQPTTSVVAELLRELALLQ